MAHYATSHGLVALLQGKWEAAASLTWKAGLLNFSSTPAALTKAAIADLNFIADLEALTGVDEMTAVGYARVALASRVDAAEDDTNDRVNFDCADWVTAAIATGQNAGAAFYYIETASTPTDSNRILVSVDIFSAVVPTNGSTITVPVADLYRVANA